MGKKKLFKRAEQPKARKHVRFVEDLEGYLKQCPRWSLAQLALEGPFGWLTLTPSDAGLVLERLRSLEQRTWNEILIQDRANNHTISVEDLAPEARSELERLELDDISEVVSLRVTGAKRIFGIQMGPVLQLLWWDPAHQVCPSQKKRT